MKALRDIEKCLGGNIVIDVYIKYITDKTLLKSNIYVTILF